MPVRNCLITRSRIVGAPPLLDESPSTDATNCPSGEISTLRYRCTNRVVGGSAADASCPAPMQASAAARITFITFSISCCSSAAAVEPEYQSCASQESSTFDARQPTVHVASHAKFGRRMRGAMCQPAVARQNTEFRHHRGRRQDQHLRHYR